MKVLQSRGNHWFLNKKRIISSSNSLHDIFFCEGCLEYSTMNRAHLVMESYEEAEDAFLNCFAAFLRFYDSYQFPSKYVWVNKDADTPFFNRMYGQGQYFLGRPPDHQYKMVAQEIGSLNGRSFVIETDWFYKFRDILVLNKF